MKNTAEIHSLSEMFKIIEDHDLGQCISRGECKYAEPLNSTALRNPQIDCTKLNRAFFTETEHLLTDIQKKHFLAFARHHSLTSNLLDMSCSPLVSLYFSIGEQPNNCKKRIYFIRNDKCINATNCLYAASPSFNLYSSIIDLDQGILNSINSQTWKCIYKNQSTTYNWLISMLESIEHVSCTSWDLIDKIKKLSKINNDQLTLQLTKILFDDLEYFTGLIYEDFLIDDSYKERYKNFIYSIINEGITEKTTSSILYAVFACKEKLVRFKTNSPYIDFPFYFTYNSQNGVDDRIKNQQSVFIYQMYGQGKLRQNIISDFTIKIPPDTTIQSNLLEEIHNLGITEAFIYSDFDHIALHINKNVLNWDDKLYYEFDNFNNCKRIMVAPDEAT